MFCGRKNMAVGNLLLYLYVLYYIYTPMLYKYK